MNKETSDSNTKSKRLSFNMVVSSDIRDIITELQEKYAVNVSQLLKNALIEHHKKLKQMDPK